MQKQYWLTQFILEPGSTKTIIAKGVEIVEQESGSLTDIVAGFGQYVAGNHIGKRVILMTYCSPATEALLLAAGLVPLTRDKNNFKLSAIKNKIPLAVRTLANNIDISFPDIPEGGD